jgi:hypothetical protein
LDLIEPEPNDEVSHNRSFVDTYGSSILSATIDFVIEINHALKRSGDVGMLSISSVWEDADAPICMQDTSGPVCQEQRMKSGALNQRSKHWTPFRKRSNRHI